MKVVLTLGCQLCARGRDDVHHLVVDCPAVASLRQWAVAYRALEQLQPKCDLSVAVPPLLTTLLGHTALKLGLPLGPAPPLQRC